LRSIREGGETITPKQVVIHFKSDRRIDVGVQGDHDVILLVCELPESFSDITNGDVDFLIDGGQKLKRHFSENQSNDIYLCQNTLYILLPRRYTSGMSLRVQVGGRTSDGTNRQVVWTPMSETIVFARSISDGYGCAPKKPHGCCHGKDDGCEDAQLTLIRDLVADSHYHSNIEALNQIAFDEEGNITWTGQPLIQLATDDDIDALFNKNNSEEDSDNDKSRPARIPRAPGALQGQSRPGRRERQLQ